MIKILMFIVSLLASFPVAIVAAFYFLDDSSVFYGLLLGILIMTIAIFIFRAIFRKERPNINSLNSKFLRTRMTRSRMRSFRDKFLELEKRSFASAHVARVGVFLSVLYLHNYSFEWTSTLLGLMVLIGVARLYLKRHRFFDLITGAVIGVAAGYVAFTIISSYAFF